MGEEEFAGLVRGALPGWGCQRISMRIARNVLAVLDDPDAVAWARRGRFRRIREELGDLQRCRALLAAVEDEMEALVAGELGLARLAEVPGLTLKGAAVILAEAGDPRRYDTSKSLVKHAGLSPADTASGASEGESHISRRGRPGLRLAAWRAVTPLLLHNPVMAAKYQALVGGRRGSRAGRAGQGETRVRAGRAGGPRPAGRPREGPRRVRRVAAALDLLHDRPRRRLGPRGRLRRPPRPCGAGGSRLTTPGWRA